MANMDVDFGMARHDRPQAMIASYRYAFREQRPAQRQPKATPKYTRIDAGQFLRTLVLLALCLSALQLTHAEKAQHEKAPVTALLTP
ncbi:hypothetical protein MJC1_01312 [Methylocystis sp. MJC1]|jgi:hypothetical protein|nr:hypothetical protein MJC1_01312 [Methylocystis sp. MJC1]